MTGTLYTKHNYLNKDIEYLKNTSIIEYDIHAAGTCILYELGLINKNTFNYLMTLDKTTRNIAVGNMLQQHPKWNKAQMNGFSEVMRRFMEKNDIEDSEILSIKKDSIVLLRGSNFIKSLNIDNLYEFRITGKYDTYMYLNGKELYLDSRAKKFDTKNFNKDVLDVQLNYFIGFIFSTLILDSKYGMKKEVYEQLKNFRTLFLGYELDDEYYFDLDDGNYIYNYDGTLLSTIYKSSDKNLYYINNNYSYLESLIKILFSS